MNKYNTNQDRKLRIIISWALVISWMAVIFMLSSQVAEQSNELSTGITQTIIEIIQKATPLWEIGSEKLNHILRKGAHFTAYMILGALVMNALCKSFGIGKRYIFWGFMICVIYAVSDEVHQAFVPGRGPALKDVLIDSAGAFTGITFLTLRKNLKKID